MLPTVLLTLLQSSPADVVFHQAPVSPTFQTLLCLQAANEALLKLLQVPKAVPQHAISQQHQQHAISQQQQQHQQQQQQQQQLQQARPLQAASAQPKPGITSHGMPTQHPQPTSTPGTSQQLPFGALQLQQQRPQLQQQQQRQQVLQQPHQQPPEATQLWQQPRVSAAASLPTGVSFLQAPTPSLGPQAALASLAPLAVQISAANLAGISQPGLAALGDQLMDSRTGESLTQQMPVMALPASLVLSGVPVGTSHPAVSSAPAVCEGHRNA